MKKGIVILMFVAIFSGCVLFAGCNSTKYLYMGNKSLISGISIRYRHLDSFGQVDKADMDMFLTNLSKTPKVKVEKSAFLDARPVANDYWAHIDVSGQTNEARNVRFYVFGNGKVQVAGEVVDSWYDSQLDEQALELIKKYQGNSFKPVDTIGTYSSASAEKVINYNETPQKKIYFTSEPDDLAVIKEFSQGLEGISLNAIPKIEIVTSFMDVLPKVVVDETYAMMYQVKTNAASRSCRIRGIVASENKIRLIVEVMINSQVNYMLADYELDGTEIRNKIKALAQ